MKTAAEMIEEISAMMDTIPQMDTVAVPARTYAYLAGVQAGNDARNANPYLDRRRIKRIERRAREATARSIPLAW